MKRSGCVQKKLLILLIGLTSAGLCYNPRKQLWILKQMGREWNRANKYTLNRAIKTLYQSKLIDIKNDVGGSTRIIITSAGEKKTLKYNIDEMSINKPKKWDRKWRLVIFDIPEEYKTTRETLRSHLKKLGFYKLQKSVFIIPYECDNEINFVLEYYNIRPYVRCVLAEQIDNELHLKKIFNI